MGELQGVIYDFHGTLAENERTHLAARREAFGQLAEFYSDERFLRIPTEIHERAHLEGRGTVGIVGWVLLRAGIVPEMNPDRHPIILQTAELQRKLYRQKAAAGVDAAPGAAEQICWSRAHFGPDKVGVATNGRQQEVNAYLLRHRVQIDAIVTKDEFGEETKPHPRPYEIALDRLGLKGCQAAVVEDSPDGLRAAEGAGVEMRLALATTYDPDVLVQAGATAVLGSLREARAHLEPMAAALA